jgi:hypothetical protein
MVLLEHAQVPILQDELGDLWISLIAYCLDVPTEIRPNKFNKLFISRLNGALTIELFNIFQYVLLGNLLSLESFLLCIQILNVTDIAIRNELENIRVSEEEVGILHHKFQGLILLNWASTFVKFLERTVSNAWYV